MISSGRLRTVTAAALALTVSVVATAKAETPVPSGVEKMLRQAAAAPDAQTLETARKLAIGAFPEREAAIKALIVRVKAEQAETVRRRQEDAARRLWAGWKGAGEAGASLSTGNGNDRSVALGLTVSKETVRWRHALGASADFRSADRRRTKERFALSYNPSYLFAPNFYAAVFLGWERDRHAGYRARFTETLGIGHTIFDDEHRRLEIEAGPGLRQVTSDGRSGIAERTDQEFVFRAAARFRYEVAESLAFSQTLLGLAGDENRTFEAASAFTAKISGDLSSRVSFTLRNESNPPAGRKPTDTLSRLTLVYDF